MTAAFAPNRILKTSASDFLRDLDLADDELLYLLDLAAEVKLAPQDYAHSLDGKSIALLFEKPSLRTRLTFEIAIRELGGGSVFCDGPIGVREPLKDVARNLDRWVCGIVARVFSQATVDGLARWSRVPVINALSDLYHPCQALADMLTLREHFGGLAGLNLTFVGDGNNMSNSWIAAAGLLGLHFVLARPAGYGPNPDILKKAQALAKISGGIIEIVEDPLKAVKGADVIYTDVWISMGDEGEQDKRRKAFKPYQINQQLINLAKKDVMVMHCLPAVRGEEITDQVMDGPNSVIFDEAENRLHIQKAILVYLLK